MSYISYLQNPKLDTTKQLWRGYLTSTTETSV